MLKIILRERKKIIIFSHSSLLMCAAQRELFFMRYFQRSKVASFEHCQPVHCSAQAVLAEHSFPLPRKSHRTLQTAAAAKPHICTHSDFVSCFQSFLANLELLPALCTALHLAEESPCPECC